LHGQLAQHLRSSEPKGHPPTPREHGEILGRLEVGWENGVLEHKSGNISETREDIEKVTMEGL